jgi:peptidyl-prolyl cis-trans isomerase C
MKTFVSQCMMIIAIGGSVSLLGCNGRSAQENEVARVGDRVLTFDMIRKQLDTTRGISQMQVRTFASRWVNSELLYQEAQRLGLDNSEEVLNEVAEAKKQLAISALLEKKIFTDTPLSISAEEVSAYYNAHREEFTLPEDVIWISLVVFADLNPANEFRSSVLQKKNTNTVEVWNASVRNLESEPRDKQSLLTKSDSVFYTESKLFPAELWKVATALGAGEVSFPVKTSAGYFVLLSLGNFKKGIIPPLAYVDEDIRQRILIEKRQQRYAQYLESLRHNYPVHINAEELGAESDSLPPHSDE